MELIDKTGTAFWGGNIYVGPTQSIYGSVWDKNFVTCAIHSSLILFAFLWDWEHFNNGFGYLHKRTRTQSLAVS